MADSVQASETGLERVDRARRQKRWNKTAETWCRKAFTSRATLNRFWARQPIRREAFIAICSAVGVDWETVADEGTFSTDETAARSEPAPSSDLQSLLARAGTSQVSSASQLGSIQATSAIGPP